MEEELNEIKDWALGIYAYDEDNVRDTVITLSKVIESQQKQILELTKQVEKLQSCIYLIHASAEVLGQALK